MRAGEIKGIDSITKVLLAKAKDFWFYKIFYTKDGTNSKVIAVSPNSKDVYIVSEDDAVDTFSNTF